MDGLCPKWGVREQRRDKLDQLVNLEIHEGPLLKEVSDVRDRRFENLGEVRELEPRRNVCNHR